MALNKRSLMVISSLAAISLTIALVAAASHSGRKHKLLQSREFLRQTASEMRIIPTIPTHSQQQKEKSKAQPQSRWQRSETRAAATTSTATISTSTAVADKEVIPDPGTIPSPMMTSSTSDSAVIVPSPSSSPSSSPSQTQKEEDISVSDEARKAGESLKELIVTAIQEAKDSAKGTGKRLKEQTINIATTADSKGIHSLGDNINFLVGIFEETMTEIRKERYNEQIKLLDSYKDLLHTHIKVVDARRRMARKLKPGA
ncbi:MAG: hypothetical protein M3251_04595 [Thermoproteota archaeon]|nr:hypothetical protein [Thermoproteota archaeon]